jgi:hypothetical protein
VGAAGLTAGSKEVLAVAALSLLLGLVAILGDVYLQKRRDDMYASAVRERGLGTELLRFITLYEAVRSGQLASADIVRLLTPSDSESETEESNMSDDRIR